MTEQGQFFFADQEYTVEQLRRMAKEDPKCRNCGQHVKVYRRRLHRTMAAGLCWLVSAWLADERWHHSGDSPRVGRILLGGGDFGKLAWWNLIYPKPNTDDTTKRDSGYWQPTDLGVRFATERCVVPTHVFELAVTPGHRILGFETSMTTIRECLRNSRFDYGELMGGA